MTNEIEMTKREMYRDLARVGGMVSTTHLYKMFESSLEIHLEALRQDRGRLVEERDALRNRVQVLESANKIAGERLRVVTEAQEQLSAISAHETQQNASCAPLDAKTAAILDAVVDVQRIVTDWATKGLKAKEAMRLVAGVVNGGPCYQAMLAFEKPQKPETTGTEIGRRFLNHKTLADIAIDKALKDLMITGMGAYRMTVGDNGIDVTTLSAEDLMADNDLSFTKATGFCQHEFHPKFPAGEMCTYCGVEKPECDHRWGPSNSSNCTKCGAVCPL